MNHPTPEAIRKVAARLQSVMPRDGSGGQVDMQESEVDRNQCGTPVCHGGWYALACYAEGRLQNETLDYGVGVLSMAEDLGFDDDVYLAAWAQGNTGLWGNDVGAFMFSSPRSFGFKHGPGESKLTLQHIIDHWLAVADRIEALDAPKPAPYTFEDARSEVRAHIARLQTQSETTE